MRVEKTTVTIGTTKRLFIHTADDRKEVAKKAKKLVKPAGGVIHWWDGSVGWFEFREVVDTTKHGSEMYTWHKDGNRVLHETVEHTVRGGNHTARVTGTCYRLMEE